MASERQMIENDFKTHVPHGDQLERYAKIRDKAKGFALFIAESCPKSKEKTLAIAKLDEAVMWANAAIARNEGG